MFFHSKNSKGKEDLREYSTLEDIIQNTLMSDEVLSEIHKHRTIHQGGRAKAYITVTYNEGRPDEQVLCLSVPNQLQDNGRDDIHNAIWENQGAAIQLGFTHMAVTVNAAGLPADAANTLLGEIAAGGLTRVDADTTTHAVGTSTTLIEHTYTATATHTAVQKGALFDANAVGTMGIVFLFAAANLVNNDTLKISVTVTYND